MLAIDIASTVCELFVIVGIGMIAAKYRLLPVNSTAVLSKLLFNIVIPALILTTMQGWEFTGTVAEDTLWSVISYILITIFIAGLSFPLVKPFRISEQDKGIYRIQLTFTNIGFMGIPLTTAVFGDRAGLCILMMNMVFTMLLYSIGVFLMLHQKGDPPFSKELLKRMVNLPLIFSFVGLLILITETRLPSLINKGLIAIADMSVPMGMLLVGIQLQKTKLAGLINRNNLIICLISLIFIPMITMWLCSLLPQSDIVTVTLVYAMAMPAGTLCAVLAEEFHRNTLLASETLTLTTLFSLVTLPVWAVVLTRMYAVT